MEMRRNFKNTKIVGTKVESIHVNSKIEQKTQMPEAITPEAMLLPPICGRVDPMSLCFFVLTHKRITVLLTKN